MHARQTRVESAVRRGLLAGLAGVLAVCVPRAVERGTPTRVAQARAATVARWAVDLATAPAWELALLPGIGRGRAYAIVSQRSREEGRALRTWDDLLDVPGIGPGIVRRLAAPDLPVRLLLHGRPLRWAREQRPEQHPWEGP